MKKLIFLTGFKRSGKDTFAKMFEEIYNTKHTTPLNKMAFADGIRTEIMMFIGKYSSDDMVKAMIKFEENKETPIWDLEPDYFPLYDKDLEMEYIKTHNMNAPKFGSYRYYLNSVGEYYKKIYGKNVWVDQIQQLIKHIHQGDFLITDLRHDVELNWVNTLSFECTPHDLTVINIDRKNAYPAWFKSNPPVIYEDIKWLQDVKGVSIHESSWVCQYGPHIHPYNITNDNGIYTNRFLVADNNGSLEDLEKEVERIYKILFED